MGYADGKLDHVAPAQSAGIEYGNDPVASSVHHKQIMQPHGEVFVQRHEVEQSVVVIFQLYEQYANVLV